MFADTAGKKLTKVELLHTRSSNAVQCVNPATTPADQNGHRRKPRSFSI